MNPTTYGLCRRCKKPVRDGEFYECTKCGASICNSCYLAELILDMMEEE